MTLDALSLPFPRRRDRDPHQGRLDRLAPEAAMIRIAITATAYRAIRSALPEDGLGDQSIVRTANALSTSRRPSSTRVWARAMSAPRVRQSRLAAKRQGVRLSQPLTRSGRRASISAVLDVPIQSAAA